MHHAYSGTPQQPYPPMTRGWAVVGYGDALARQRAIELSQYRGDGTDLPLWHYADELLASSNGAGGGLYRMFHYADDAGQCGIGCMRFVGTQMLGQDDGGTTDGGTDEGEGSSTPTSGAGLQQGSSGATDSGTGTNTDAPSSGGGGGGTTPTQLPPAPTPTTPSTTTTAASSSNTGLIVGIVAAVAVAATVVVAASAKGGKKARR